MPRTKKSAAAPPAVRRTVDLSQRQARPGDPLAAWRADPKTDAVLRADSLTIGRVGTCRKKDGADAIVALLGDLSAEERDATVAEAEKTDGDVVASFTISTGRVDSYKDTIDPNGWELADFKRNPVVLFAHDQYSPNVAVDVGVYAVKNTALRGTAVFASKDLNPFGDMIGRMVAAGFLRATSVGFQPIEWEYNEERDEGGWFPPVDFKKQMLREYSVVPVPANPDCLIDGRSMRAAGIDVEPFVEWVDKMLDGAGGHLFVPRSVLEEARRAAAGEVLVFDGGLGIVRVDAAAAGELVDPDASTDEGDPPAEEQEADGTMQCPMCDYVGKASEFSVDEPAGDDAKAAGIATEALVRELRRRGVEPRLDSGSGASNASPVDAAMAYAAKRAHEHAARRMIEETGELP